MDTVVVRKIHCDVEERSQRAKSEEPTPLARVEPREHAVTREPRQEINQNPTCEAEQQSMSMAAVMQQVPEFPGGQPPRIEKVQIGQIRGDCAREACQNDELRARSSQRPLPQEHCTIGDQETGERVGDVIHGRCIPRRPLRWIRHSGDSR